MRFEELLKKYRKGLISKREVTGLYKMHKKEIINLEAVEKVLNVKVEENPKLYFDRGLIDIDEYNYLISK